MVKSVTNAVHPKNIKNPALYKELFYGVSEKMKAQRDDLNKKNIFLSSFVFFFFFGNVTENKLP